MQEKSGILEGGEGCLEERKGVGTEYLPRETYLTVKELCEWLKIEKATVYDYTYRRKIPFVRFGKLLRFPQSVIESWLRNPEEVSKSFFENRKEGSYEFKETRRGKVSSRLELLRRRKALPPPPDGLRLAKGSP